MGFLDRFKKQKEQEVGKAAPVSSVVKEQVVKPDEPVVLKKEEAKGMKEVKGPKTLKRPVPEEIVSVLVRPLVTEKSAVLASMGQYVFVVKNEANRVAVGQAVKALYGIQPISVRIQNVRSKTVRFGRRTGKRKAWKKAIVALPKGKTIDVYAGV